MTDTGKHEAARRGYERAAGRWSCTSNNFARKRLTLWRALGLAAVVASTAAVSIAIPASAEALPPRSQRTLDQALTRPGWDLPEFKQALVAYRSGNCRGAWELLWPLAKQNNLPARYLLWTTMNGRMQPPGSVGGPHSVMDRHVLTLSAYATLLPESANPTAGDPEHRWARAEIPNAIKRLGLGAGAEQVAECYRSGPPFQTCLDLAVSTGVIQKFEDYAVGVDAVMSSGRRASCLPRH